jgi:hypothetical protein
MWIVPNLINREFRSQSSKVLFTGSVVKSFLKETHSKGLIINPSVLGPLHTWDWEPATIALQALSLVEKAGSIQVRFTLRLRDQRSMWMQDGCKVYMDSYMASNGSCFMVTWTILNNHLLEVGLTQNQETMALRTLTTVGLFHFIMCDDPHE